MHPCLKPLGSVAFFNCCRITKRYLEVSDSSNSLSKSTMPLWFMPWTVNAKNLNDAGILERAEKYTLLAKSKY